MNILKNTLVPLMIAMSLFGCSGGGDTGVPATVTNELQGLAGTAKAAGGDYSKLSDADKKKFIDRAGSEAEAQKMVSRMASGPGSAGGPSGPPKK